MEEILRPEQAFPYTLEATDENFLGRRLERLDEVGRKILTSAAVLGRRFGYSMLESIGCDSAG